MKRGLLLLCLLAFAAGATQVSGQVGSGRPFVTTAGVDDCFALPTEPACPSAELATFILNVLGKPLRAFDEGDGNKTLGHTFNDLPDGYNEIWVTMRLRASGDPLTYNDTVNFEFNPDWIPGEVSAWGWGLYISSIVGWWGPGSETTITLNLADLPPDPRGRTSVMNLLEDGMLDVCVDDDTIVDYIMLTSCEVPVDVNAETWGGVKALYR